MNKKHVLVISMALIALCVGLLDSGLLNGLKYTAMLTKAVGLSTIMWAGLAWADKRPRGAAKQPGHKLTDEEIAAISQLFMDSGEVHAFLVKGEVMYAPRA